MKNGNVKGFRAFDAILYNHRTATEIKVGQRLRTRKAAEAVALREWQKASDEDRPWIDFYVNESETQAADC